MSEDDIAVLRLALCKAQGYLQELVSQEDRPGAQSVLQEINAALEITRRSDGRTHWDECWRQPRGHHDCYRRKAREAIEEMARDAAEVSQRPAEIWKHYLTPTAYELMSNES